MNPTAATTAAAPSAPQRGYGLLRVLNNDDIRAQEEAAAQAKQASQQQEQVEASLAGYVRRCWEEAKQAKLPVEQRMLQSLRARKGEYEPDVLSDIRTQGGSEIYLLLTDLKCRAVEAWVHDILSMERPWTLDPTPIPELSPEIEEGLRQVMLMEAQARGIPPEQANEKFPAVRDEFKKRLKEVSQKAISRMADVIDDQMVEGGWRKGFDEFVYDFATYPAAFIKGPVARQRKRMSWIQSMAGKFMPQFTRKVQPEYERVSPWFIYPSPDSTGIDDGYLLEHYRMRRGNLHSLIGVEGFNEEAIRKALDEYGRGGLRKWMWHETELARLQDRPMEYLTEHTQIDALIFWGPAQGKLLREWGMSSKDVPDELAEYEIEAWLIGNYLVRVAINDGPTIGRPYSKASYSEIPGAFWGEDVPDKLRDVQRMCNATGRALANNLGIASGPQAEVHVDRLPEGTAITKMYPWKIWQTLSDKSGSGRQAVHFFQPNPMAEMLLMVLDRFEKRADELTVPAYTYGDNQRLRGAGDTASGLSMLMGAATKNIKKVISNIDMGIFETVIHRAYVYNMLYHDDETIKGDAKPKARGASSLIQKEQAQLRRMEFLQATNNPMDAAIIDLPRRAAVLRETAKALDMPVEEVVPSKEEMIEMAMMQAGAFSPGTGMVPSRSLDPAGNPVSGQDSRLFNPSAA